MVTFTFYLLGVIALFLLGIYFISQDSVKFNHVVEELPLDGYRDDINPGRIVKLKTSIVAAYQHKYYMVIAVTHNTTLFDSKTILKLEPVNVFRYWSYKIGKIKNKIVW